MDFLNKSFAQLSDLFKAMTPGARLTAGLLLVVIVVSLGFLFQRQASGPDAFLMGGEPFPAAQLGDIEAAFGKANLTGAVIEGNRIRVPRNQQAHYMAALADAGALPPNFGTYLEKAIASESPFAMRGSREEKLKLAKQQELQNVMRRMEGIESAAVLYDAKDKRSFGQEPTATASVSVKPKGNLPLTQNQIRSLRYMVKAAFAGLQASDVTVTDLSTGQAYIGHSDTPGAGDSQDDAYASRKRMYEQDWTNKIREVMSFIPGVIVQTNVEINPQTAHEESLTTYEAKAVPYNQKETNTTKTVEPVNTAGPPGFGAQQPGGINQAARIGSSTAIKSSEETNHTEAQQKIPTTVVRKTEHGLTPKHIQVSIGIPTTYYETVWATENPPAAGQPASKPTPADLARIKETVKTDVERATVTLIDKSDLPADKFPRINVWSFAPPPMAVPIMPGFQDNALAWLAQNWSTLGMIALALLGLRFLRSMIKSMPAPAPVTAASQAVEMQPKLSVVAAGEEAAPGEEGAPKRSRLKRRGGGGPSLRDELSEMVREDPDAAVSILRNWIGNAG
jgi:flagellar M-ring protein FliF